MAARKSIAACSASAVGLEGRDRTEGHRLGRPPATRQGERDDRADQRESREDGDRGRKPVEERIG
jgi:hypothetical protein